MLNEWNIYLPPYATPTLLIKVVGFEIHSAAFVNLSKLNVKMSNYIFPIAVAPWVNNSINFVLGLPQT